MQNVKLLLASYNINVLIIIVSTALILAINLVSRGRQNLWGLFVSYFILP